MADTRHDAEPEASRVACNSAQHRVASRRSGGWPTFSDSLLYRSQLSRRAGSRGTNCVPWVLGEGGVLRWRHVAWASPASRGDPHPRGHRSGRWANGEPLLCHGQSSPRACSCFGGGIRASVPRTCLVRGLPLQILAFSSAPKSHTNKRGDAALAEVCLRNTILRSQLIIAKASARSLSQRFPG